MRKKAKDYNLNPGLYRKTIKGKQKWEVVSLKEICDIQKGTSITRADTVEGNIPVIAGGQEPAYYHNQSNRDGNIITVSASGAYAGFVSYFDVPIFASDCTTIKSSDEEKALTKYIFYVLKSRQEDLYKLQRGAGQPHVYPNDLANIQIPLPPLPVQQELVTRLDKQQAIIEQCNAMERAILEAGIDDSIFEGDWEWVELPDVVEINPESMNPENEPEKEFIYIDISSVDNKTFTITDYKFISGKNAPSRARRVVKIGDVLISTVRPNLKSFCIIDDERFNNQICSTGFAVLRSKNEVILPRFLFFYVLSDIFVSELTKLMEKSQYPSITQTDLSYIKVPLPPIEKQQKIVDFLNVQFETLTNIRRLKENAKQTIKMILDREVFGE